MSRVALRPPGPRSWLVLLVLVVAGVAATPALLGGSDLTDVSLAVTRAAMAAGAAVALSAGRPSLAMAGLGGAAGYTSALASIHGWPVPLAISAGAALAAFGAAALGLLGARLGAAAFAAFTLVATLAGGALLAALPGVFGGSGGLQPVPPLSFPLPGGDSLTFSEVGTLHVTLTLCALAVAVAALLVQALPGARWRAAGSDPERSADAGLHPLRSRLAALAAGGLLAGIGGALGVHAAGVASPSAFSADAAVVPLLAALLAGRGGPALAALIGGATAALGLRVLPNLGWSGPPSADALATGILAAATLLALPALLRRGGVRGERVLPAPPPEAPWPGVAPQGGPAGLRVTALAVVPERGAAPLAVLDLDVLPGAVHGLAGPNGAGKSTALRAVATGARHGGEQAVRVHGASPAARAVLLPQAGGGWPGTTVEETLRLAARAGHRPRGETRRAAGTWIARLGLTGATGALCETLSHGARRRVELARVLLLRPAVLLCDEPLAGLGDADRALVLACLRAAAADGVTLVVAEHDRASLSRLAAATTELRPLDPGPAAAPDGAPA